ncbi:MAG: LamG-like jellyroll fold domain-containing protein [Candidatus Paceibacterota bacterium]|jgi:prepilin-type N-terminal cleavage/methylation domain-containing protein
MNKLIKQAFTLIELLVVIAIIGILSGLIVVSMSGVTQKANIAKAQVFSNSLRNSLMLNLVSEWKFDTSILTDRPTIDADVVDTWGGVNNGTIPASPSIPTTKTSSSCVNGSCLSFDGSDDYVNIVSSSNLKIADTLTMSAWIRSDVIPSSAWQCVFGKRTASWYGYMLTLQTNGKVGAYVANGSEYQVYSDSSIIPNTWYYIVGTYNGNNLKLYINGISQLDIKVASLNGSSNTNDMTIGVDPAGGNQFDGLIDEVRLYNAAIPTSQIKEQYYLGLNNLLINGNISQEEYSNKINSTANE